MFTDYSFMSEHTDLRHIMGVGIAITRGAAASLSFCYCLLLLTMSRNLITRLKEWSLQQYIPLDSHIPVLVNTHLCPYLMRVFERIAYFCLQRERNIGHKWDNPFFLNIAFTQQTKICYSFENLH